MNADSLIIGGGIHGCSAAYYLSKLGFKVTVLEKDWVSRHASGVNAGGVRLLGRHPAEVALSKASMELWANLDEELDANTGFLSRSHINIAIDEADIETMNQRQAEMHSLGYFHEKLIDQKELRERLPAIAPHCIGGVVSEVDGYAIPYQSTNAFRHAAVRLGAKFIEGSVVHNVRKVGENWLIESSQGQFEAEHLVNCAGAWADKVAIMIGDNAPLSFSAPMLAITSRMPQFISPVVGAVNGVLSFKQFENGTVLIGGGLKGFADRDKNQTRLDYKKMAANAYHAADFFPIMKTASINRMWAGIEAYMPDKIPVIGKSLNADKAYHAFGFSAHGFQMGPIIGKMMAELIVNGSPSLSLDAFNISRFEANKV